MNKCFNYIQVLYLAVSMISLNLFKLNGEKIQLDFDQNENLQNKIAFDLPDLTAIFTLPDQKTKVQLEAFRSRLNDKILTENETSKHSQLMWVSTGNPRIVMTKIDQKGGSELFHFTPEGFYTFVEMLNDDHIKLLAEKAKMFYKTDIAHSQIINLVLSKFECSIILFSMYSKTLIKGRVNQFRVFPLRLDFLAPIGTKERQNFIKRLKDDKSSITIHCEIASQGVELKTNTLKITANQFDHINLVDKIFGPAKESYITREQANALSQDIYSILNIMEEYQMSETEFKESFVKDFVNFASKNTFKALPLTEALGLLSTYCIDFEEDLKADIIKKEASKILRIQKFRNVSHIVIDEKGLQNLKESGKVNWGTGGGGSFMKIFSIRGTANKVSESNSEWFKSNKSLTDQLKELNRYVNDEVEWQFEGDKIVPKSISVARLARGEFSRTMTFNRVRKQFYEAPFIRKFTLYISSATEEKDEIEIMKNYIQDYKEQLEALGTESVEKDNQLSLIVSDTEARLAKLEQRVLHIDDLVKDSSENFQRAIRNLNEALAAQRYEIMSGSWVISIKVHGYPTISRIGVFNKTFKKMPKIFYTIKALHVGNNVAALYKMTNERITTSQFTCDINFFGVFHALELEIEWIAYGLV